MAYSIDYIKRAAAYKQEGHTFKQLREAFNISSVTCYDRSSKLENVFEFGVKSKQHRNRKINKQAVVGKLDAFLEEYAKSTIQLYVSGGLLYP